MAVDDFPTVKSSRLGRVIPSLAWNDSFVGPGISKVAVEVRSMPKGPKAQRFRATSNVPVTDLCFFISLVGAFGLGYVPSRCLYMTQVLYN